MSQTHLNLDCQRVLCPLPVIRVQDAAAMLRPDDLVTAVCSDPGVLADLPAWCRINGHAVLDTRQEDDRYTVTLRLGSPA